jgi:fructoselysine-6-P-deglycase FrlB-like protein
LSEQQNPHLETLQSQIHSPPTVLLGEWEGEWIAHEIALKLTEMAGVRAVAFGSEEYFHGPQLFLQQSKIQEKIWYAGSVSDSRRDALAQIKIAYEANWNESETISWVNSLVHLQWATLALALNLGVNPDTGQIGLKSVQPGI